MAIRRRVKKVVETVEPATAIQPEATRPKQQSCFSECANYLPSGRGTCANYEGCPNCPSGCGDWLK